MQDATSRQSPYLVDSSMSAPERPPAPSKPCAFCGHVNSADAKFCGGCGVQVNQLACLHCGAMNDSAAATCRECNAPLPRPVNESVGLKPAAGGIAGAVKRPASKLIPIAIVALLVALVAYYAYRELSVFFVVEPWGNVVRPPQ